jgi:hypothetical protein
MALATSRPGKGSRRGPAADAVNSTHVAAREIVEKKYKRAGQKDAFHQFARDKTAAENGSIIRPLTGRDIVLIVDKNDELLAFFFAEAFQLLLARTFCRRLLRVLTSISTTRQFRNRILLGILSTGPNIYRRIHNSTFVDRTIHIMRKLVLSTVAPGVVSLMVGARKFVFSRLI